MQNLIIHAGIAKTGSTTIQSTLAKNRAVLLDHGFCYPGNSDAHYCNSQEDLNLLLTENPTANIILSAESFFWNDILLKNELVCNFHIKIIAYIRILPSWYEAMYSELLKKKATFWFLWNESPFHLPDYTLFDDGIFPLPNIASCCTRFGKENCLFFSFEEASHKNLLDHFCSAANLSMLELCNDASQNISLCTDFLYFMMHLKMLPIASMHYQKILDFLTTKSTQYHGKKYLLIPKDEHFDYLHTHKKDLDYISMLINDNTYTQKCYNWLEDKENCPYNNLPIYIQHKIFNLLPSELQNDIYDAWPMAQSAKENEPLFPNFPTNKEIHNIIEGFLRLEAWYSSIITNLNEQVSALQLCIAKEHTQSTSVSMQLAVQKNHFSHYRPHLGPLHPSFPMRFLTGKPPFRIREAIQHLNHPENYTTEQIQESINKVLANQKSLAYLSRRAFWKKLLRKLHIVK